MGLWFYPSAEKTGAHTLTIWLLRDISFFFMHDEEVADKSE
jgi:hypothetical protein